MKQQWDKERIRKMPPLICISLALTEMMRYFVNWNIIYDIIFSKLMSNLLVGKALM